MTTSLSDLVADFLSHDRKEDEDFLKLSDMIRLLAISEASEANDSARRLKEIQNIPPHKVVQLYLDENPEVRRFVERHIEARTCSFGARDLRTKMAEFGRWKQMEAATQQSKATIFGQLSATSARRKIL